MAWRSVVITQPARLRLEQRALSVDADAGTIRIPLEDISVLVIDQPQVLLSAQLLSACAEQQIAVLKPIGHRTQQLCSSPPLPR